MTGRREDEEGGIRIAGGRFVEPAATRNLPPVRTFQLQDAYPVMMEPGADAPFHIGAALSGCGLTLVTVVYGSTVQNLWQNGSLVTPAPTIPVGLSWEIHTTYNILSNSACTWCITCMVNNNPAPPGIHGERASSAYSSYGKTGWDFNCGAMPSSAVAVRIKFWYIADNYTAYPTQDMW